MLSSQCPCGTISGRDEDCDCIDDILEQALAEKYAPEWRFSKRTIYPNDEIGIKSSNQNKDFEENYPCSVEYLIYGNVAARDGLPQVRLSSPPNGYVDLVYTDFLHINDIMTNPLAPSGRLANKTSENIKGCADTPDDSVFVCLSYKNDLKGEPNSFPTYYNCRKASDYIAITYFLFSAFDNKHETCGCNHRGDWEYYTIFIDINSVTLNNQNFTINDIANSKIEWFKFKQHSVPAQRLNAKSDRIRWVNSTHPKIYVARTSHAIYPEPGVLYDIDPKNGWEFWFGSLFDFHVYDDIFIGNGLVVQSWERKNIINIGGTQKIMKDREWAGFRGNWGCDGGVSGPICKLNEEKFDNLEITDWETWITTDPNGHKKYWSTQKSLSIPGIYLDCDVKYSNNYVPNPNYGCTQVIDNRRTCYPNGNILTSYGSDVQVWGSPKQAVDNWSSNNTEQVGIFPGYYQGAVRLDKKMILKAVEGKVTIGKAKE